MEPKSGTGLKYFLYARKSTESDDRQAASIEDQLAEMTKVAERFNLAIVGTVTESRSAKRPGRPEFNRMIERLHAGEANAILCWKLNRLARNPVDGGQISWMLQQGSIKHIQTFSSEFKPSDNVVIMQIEFGMANQYVKDLSADTARGLRNKARRGWHPSARLVAGYKHAAERAGEMNEIVRDENFVLMQNLWGKMLSGAYSIPDIKREGDRIGLRNRSGNVYSLNNYRCLFTNEFYSGWFTWKSEDGSPERIKGLHPRMVTEQEFDRVQLYLGRRGKPTRKNKYVFAFRISQLHCGACGRSITAEQKVQARCTRCRYKFSIRNSTDCPKCHTDLSEMNRPHIVDRTYYLCVGGTKGKCPQKSAIEERELERQIRQAIDLIAIPKEFHDWATGAINYVTAQETAEHARELSAARNRESSLLQRLDRIVILRANEEISAERFKTLNDKTERDLAAVRREQQTFHAQCIDWGHLANNYLTFAETASKRFSQGNAETKRKVLEGLSPNLTLKDKILTISLPIPLLRLRNACAAITKNRGWLEPEKNGRKQGVFQRIAPDKNIGLGELREVRTAILGMSASEIAHAMTIAYPEEPQRQEGAVARLTSF